MNNRTSYIVGIVLVLAIGLGILAGPLQAQDDTSELQNIRFIRDLFYTINDSRTLGYYVSEFYAPSWTWHDPHGPTSTQENRETIIDAFNVLAHVFPDDVWMVEKTAATGDIVMVQYSFRGTFEADWTPWGSNNSLCKATGEEVAWEGVYIYRLEDGFIVEQWHYWDNPLVNQPDEYCGE